MPLRLYSAIVTGDVAKSTCDDLDGLDNARARVELLAKLVEKASTAIEARIQADPTDSPTQQVFLAPEYFFSKKRRLNKRFFNHNLKRWIVGQLAATSKNFPKMVIVPGTVLWSKEAVRHTDDSMDLGTRLTIEMRNVKRLQKLRGQMNTAFNKGYLAKGQESMQTTRAKGVTKFDSNTNTLTYNMDKAEQEGLKIVQNTAYVLLGGKVLKYHKRGNFAEVENEKGAMVFQPGAVDGRFRLGGVRYGLEICLDHNIGMLTRDVDVQLVVSSYVNFVESHMRGALFLHSSTEKHGTFPDGKGGTVQVKTEPSYRTTDVKFHHRFKVGDVDILVYDLPNVKANKNLNLRGRSIGEVSHIHDPDTLGL